MLLVALSGCATSRGAMAPAGPCDTAVERYDTDKRRAQQAIGVRDCFARARDEAGLERFLTGRRVSLDARHRAAFKMFMAAHLTLALRRNPRVATREADSGLYFRTAHRLLRRRVVRDWRCVELESSSAS